MNQINHKTQRGFTLIELTLALTFISFLLLAVAMVLIHMSNTYSRGVTLKSVNQVGRELTDSIRRDIASAPAFDPAETGPNQRYVEMKSGELQTGGRLCLGSVSYVWNYAEALKETGSSVTDRLNRYSSGEDAIRLVRVADQGAALCRPTAVDGASPSRIDPQQATELLVNDDRIDLALYTPQRPAVERYAADTSGAIHQALYTVRFVVGTNEIGAIDTSNQRCQPPVSDQQNFDFCAINIFEITARASNQ